MSFVGIQGRFRVNRVVDRPVMNPFVLLGTKIVEFSLWPYTRVPVTAVTGTSKVMSVPKLVMNCLAPLITHSPFSRRDVVRVPPASEPDPGSVSLTLANSQIGQPSTFLLFYTEPVDRYGHQICPRLQRYRHRLINFAELLERHRQCEITATQAAIPLGKRQPDQSHLIHLGDIIVRKGLLLLVFS